MDKDEKIQEMELEETLEKLENEEQVETVTKKEFDKLKEVVVQFENNYKRALADYQNLVRRTQEQKSEWIRMSNKELILKILPILDTLMLTAKHFEEKSLFLTIDQFVKMLEEEGVTKILTVGEQFNPHTMEAITTMAGEKEIVVDEARTGYMLGEIVLRPAQVVVGNGEKGEVN